MIRNRSAAYWPHIITTRTKSGNTTHPTPNEIPSSYSRGRASTSMLCQHCLRYYHSLASKMAQILYCQYGHHIIFRGSRPQMIFVLDGPTLEFHDSFPNNVRRSWPCAAYWRNILQLYCGSICCVRWLCDAAWFVLATSLDLK